MASSKPKMSPQEISELVQNLHSMGQLEDVMREARLGVPVVTGESMNDSSKRRLFAEDEEDAEFEYIPADGYEGPTWRKRQQPIMPKPTGGSSATEARVGSHVPEMELSVADWGKTICDLPKVARRHLTYDEMIKEATTDDPMKEYLMWILHTGIKSAKVDDLRKYLNVVGWSANKDKYATQMTYPGTTMVRRMKWRIQRFFILIWKGFLRSVKSLQDPWAIQHMAMHVLFRRDLNELKVSRKAERPHVRPRVGLSAFAYIYSIYFKVIFGL